MTVETFDYTGSDQTWDVPSGVTLVTVACYGAEGGGLLPGKGGSISCALVVTPGETLTLVVGQHPTGAGAVYGGAGVSGGGGEGAGSGGGASCVIQAAAKVVIAGGGGGTGGDVQSGHPHGLAQGGAGSGANGTAGANGVPRPGNPTPTGGGGGTQVAGGAAGTNSDGTPTAGSLGAGGNGGTGASGGGGGGYYGGGGGAGANNVANFVGGGGGGGSGLGTGVSEATDGGVRSGHGQIVITYGEGCDCQCIAVEWRHPVEVAALLDDSRQAFKGGPWYALLDRIEPLLEQRDRVLEARISRLCSGISGDVTACDCLKIEWRFPVEIQAILGDIRAQFRNPLLLGFLDRLEPLLEQRDRVIEDHLSDICQASDDEACTCTKVEWRFPVEIEALADAAKEAFPKWTDMIDQIANLLEVRDRGLEDYLGTLCSAFVDAP